MTDTSIRVSDETRKRLNLYRAQHDITQDEAIQMLLDNSNAPEVSNG